MTILEALKTKEARVASGERWLIADENGQFQVFETSWRGRGFENIYIGFDEEEAVEYLFGKR